MIPGIRIQIAMRTKPPNAGELRGLTLAARRAHFAQARKQSDQVRAHVLEALGRRQLRGEDLVPVLVTMTRISAGHTDDDGVVGALKHVRDGVARALGINDGDEARLRFAYAQRLGDRGKPAVEILIEKGALLEHATPAQRLQQLAADVEAERAKLPGSLAWRMDQVVILLRDTAALVGAKP